MGNGASGKGREIIGSKAAEHLVGGSRNDAIYGLGGNDTLFGDRGSDQLFGGAGRDQLDGGAGDDFLLGGSGRDTFNGGSGYDTISFSDSNASRGAIADLSTGRIENDGFGNRETIRSIEGFSGGTLFADRFTGNDGDNSFFLDRGDTGRGLGGDDSFLIGGAASIDGGAGRDILSGFTLETYVADSKGVVSIATATHGVDVDLTVGKILDDGFGGSATIRGIEDVRGSDLADKLRGDGGANVLLSGDASDTLSGERGNDTLWGENGNDILAGGGGRDWLLGEKGNDRLDGGSGADNLHGGAGKDVLTGGTNADRFIFEAGDTAAGRSDADIITDFRSKSGDKIDLSLIEIGAGGKNDCFEFIGSHAFSGQQGEVRTYERGGDTYVTADIDGDRTSDLTIRLDGLHDLKPGDFIF